MNVTTQAHDTDDQKATNSMNCQPIAGKTDTGINSYPA